MEQDILATKRHSLAHLLAIAVKERFPGTRFGIGPAIENGFYYDMDLPAGTTVTSEDLAALTARMRTLVSTPLTFVRKEVTVDEARELFKDNPFKTELINEYATEGRTLSVYESGDFNDLCEGPHVETTSVIDPESFTLSSIAGAYWRGSEKNPMLMRVYGFAFASKDELNAHLTLLEEAKKRDHRKVGKELDLFTFSELVGPGLPLWTPRGTILRTELDNYIWELRLRHGYQRVTIPHITKKDLYQTSGHWDKFADELFVIETREGKQYAVKPMNCPHHTQIFDRKPHSYREMPQRYAETTMVYRDEQSGELGGLTRVLSITQDDSHVFCRHSQVKEEFFRIWDIIDTFYSTFGFNLRVRLSFHEPSEMHKYLGDASIWQNAEQALREIAQERNADYFEAPGEAAMYGPKLDFMAKDSIGREHQVATIQLDMNLPERFDLSCISEQGTKERIVMIHAAIMGSIERFTAVLLEHLAGNFPLWLAPEQVRILPIGEGRHAYARAVETSLRKADIRVFVDDNNETLGKRIRSAKTNKVPYTVVIGEAEVVNETVTLEGRAGKVGELSTADLVARLTKEIEEKTQ
jgi:threonyl-tRNA synthetase